MSGESVISSRYRYIQERKQIVFFQFIRKRYTFVPGIHILLKLIMVLTVTTQQGSPLGPDYANMSYHEKKWLDECPDEIKPIKYRRYVDDIFLRD